MSPKYLGHHRKVEPREPTMVSLCFSVVITYLADELFGE